MASFFSFSCTVVSAVCNFCGNLLTKDVKLEIQKTHTYTHTTLTKTDFKLPRSCKAQSSKQHTHALEHAHTWPKLALSCHGPIKRNHPKDTHAHTFTKTNTCEVAVCCVPECVRGKPLVKWSVCSCVQLSEVSSGGQDAGPVGWPGLYSSSRDGPVRVDLFSLKTNTHKKHYKK